MMKNIFLYLSLYHYLFAARQCLALIPENGTCTLFIYVPFTYDGEDISRIWNRTNVSWGLMHMASALIAVEHFNMRNPTIFKELENMTNCPIKLDARVLDSRVVGHGAAQSFTEQGVIPCAIAGPFSDQPALELSTLATAHQFPLVAYRVFNDRLSSKKINPFSSQVFPDLHATTDALVSFLLFANRTNYISFLYPATDVGTQRREALTHKMDSNGMRWYAEPYQGDHEDLLEEMKQVLQKAKDKGYRTIVVSMDDPVIRHLVSLARAADELGMSDGDYFWIWMGTIEVFRDYPSEISVKKILEGSVWVISGEDYYLDPSDNPFLKTWSQQSNTNFADRVNSANPIPEGEPGYAVATPELFSSVIPDWGSGLVADAVMSIGLGACIAAKEKFNASTVISGQEHLQKIRSISFRGASAETIRFSPDSPDRPGTRDPNTALWAIMNFKAAPNTSEYRMAGVEPGEPVMRVIGGRRGLNDWELVEPIVYANGSMLAPELRDLPDQHYLHPALQAFGLALMSTVILLGLITIIWVYVHREHPVLLAAQPRFLYAIAFGCVVFSISIFLISFDESYGWTEEQLTRACMANPWFFAIGYMMIYGALYSKLWRVNRVLQFSRRSVSFYRAVLPFGILLALTVVSLSLTTALDPSEWSREIVDDDTGASIGRCTGGNSGVVGLLMIIVTVMAACYAWRTRDVDSAYSESWWILMLVLLQVEVYIVAVPVIVLLEDVSTDGFYFGNVIVIWIFPISTLVFIMIPKVSAHYKAEHNISDRVRGAGGRGNTNISGVTAATRNSNSMPGNSITPRSSSATERLQREEDTGGTQVLELTGPALQEVLTCEGATPTQGTIREHHPGPSAM